MKSSKKKKKKKGTNIDTVIMTNTIGEEEKENPR
jgi:hypothetical protein